MNRFWTAVLFLVYFCIGPGCQSQPEIKGLVDTLTTGGYKEGNDSIPIGDTTNSLEMRFKRLGKSAIPYLIDAIDRNERGWVGFNSPLSSNLGHNVDAYTGIRAAYMIEYLLSDSSDDQIYRLGVIARLNRQTGNYSEPLTYDDVKAVKKIYQSWWKANKDKSMQELQREWRGGKRIVNGISGYAWV